MKKTSSTLSDTTVENDAKPERLRAKYPSIRCSAEHLKKVQKRADAADMSFSEYVRFMSETGGAKKVIREEKVTLDPYLKQGIHGAWNNLNQIAKRLNAIDADDHPKVEVLLDDMARLFDQHERFFDWMLDQLHKQ